MVKKAGSLSDSVSRRSEIESRAFSFCWARIWQNANAFCQKGVALRWIILST